MDENAPEAINSYIADGIFALQKNEAVAYSSMSLQMIRCRFSPTHL